ncbi:hypothetical protein JQ600_20165 [Bradyrhizobium sp. AUGA SZCCT0176]|uniref:hypothetical protein n=1 Tax=Bradyrhizobium sp. AUGA SZCCT0176 TaxID=2807664 RepID=UPI001BA9FBE3|nr:hypothetical protein [Bradyrhizobium sp. AUGA SZCCT0176]MBR1227247.1 hypothetical protein [Bradyrhizobium sp. AUGA SZCCT0176]
MRTASEAKRRIIEHLAALNMTLADVTDWQLHIESDDGGGNTVSVYYSWHGDGSLCSFDWPWGAASFDSAGYERFFSGKRLVRQ